MLRGRLILGSSLVLRSRLARRSLLVRRSRLIPGSRLVLRSRLLLRVFQLRLHWLVLEPKLRRLLLLLRARRSRQHCLLILMPCMWLRCWLCLLLPFLHVPSLRRCLQGHMQHNAARGCGEAQPGEW